jgi:hypothetical protein
MKHDGSPLYSAVLKAVLAPPYVALENEKLNHRCYSVRELPLINQVANRWLRGCNQVRRS